MNGSPAALTILLAFTGVAAAQGRTAPRSQPAPANLVEIDASGPIPQPEAGFLRLGGTSATGHALEINSRYLTLDGKPMLPVMGEFHFARFPAEYWEEEILKMKAAGVNVVAAYIFWIHHEEIEGQFDWSGQRNLRHFVELCAKHGMYVYLRPGPWAHGEVRNGGFPDWLLANKNVRTNDPDYLAHVARFDREIGVQIKGLLWKDGGPIIGAQLENEYGQHGAGKGAEHIAKLKELAIAGGMDVPLYSVTGWPSLDFPPHEVIPVSGGYPDGFWFGSLTNLPPSMNYLFNLNRKLGDMGATSPTEDPTGKVDLRHDPYFAAEEAGGMELAYHRRPLMQPDDIAALTLTGIGSGLNLYGYYMFHGGINPHGKLTTLQESQATKYPNDLPEYNYDFQAPLGEYGQVRESYRKTKLLHLFLNAFGSDLAQMVATGPDRTPANAADSSVPRVAVRTRGESAFLFVNNYVRQLPMPARPGFQVHLKLPGGPVTIPATPVTIPADSYLCWPVNLPVGSARLQYSTAQLLTKLNTPGEPTYVFFALPGIPAEFAFDAHTVSSLTATGQKPIRSAGSLRLEHAQPSATPIEIRSTTGERTRILLLTEAEAESASILPSATGEHLALSPASVFLDAKELHLRSTDRQSLDLRVFPAFSASPVANFPVTSTNHAGWSDLRYTPPEATIPFQWKKTKDAESVPPVQLSPTTPRHKGLAHVPPDEAFHAAAEWQFTLSQPLPPGVSDLWLTLDYTGDIARLSMGDTLVDDDFFHGAPWEIGLKRYLAAGQNTTLRLQVLPLRSDAPIYLDPAVRAALPNQPQTAELSHVTLHPEYEIVLTLP